MKDMAPAIFLLLIASTACTHQPQPEPAIGWRPVGSWSGHGNAQTDSFNIESGQWRIKWATTNEHPAGAGSFRATVHSAVSGRPFMVAVDHRGAGNGIAYVNEDPRLFDLD